jgi:AcrR family transcriptional regulator
MPEIILKGEETTRATNMARRRALILSHARDVIANEGFEALKLRDLATRANITVPTIYNLIGGKSDILTLIIEDLVTRLEAVHKNANQSNVEDVFEAQIDTRLELFAKDESYYRAAYIAGDRIGLFEQNSPSGLYKRSLHLTISSCREAIDADLLFGRVASEQLGRQVYSCYRHARQDWVFGYYDLEGLRKQALTGIFLSLAADAKPAFHKRLMQRLEILSY